MVLARRMVKVRTRWGVVTFKVAGTGAEFHASPEYSDVVKLARNAGVPVRLVLEDVRSHWRKAAKKPRVRRGQIS